MNVWKVIFAAVVIFAAGVVTGGLTVRLKSPPAQSAPAFSALGPLRQRPEFLDRMQRQLYLTPNQREHIEQILRENHDRMKQLWDSIAPQAQEEHRRVQERILNELSPEQQKRFEELTKSRPWTRSPEDRRRHEERHEPKAGRHTNAPAPSLPEKKSRELTQ